MSTEISEHRRAGMSSRGRNMETVHTELSQNAKSRRGYLFVKRFFDIVLSAIALLVLLPVLLAIACLIKREDHGPVFYRHERLGIHGRKICVYKFRSMKPGSDDLTALTSEQLEEYYREFKITNDPRVTKIGLRLRRTFLDELPQLINILRGEMSFVGPRPIMEEELRRHYPEWKQPQFLSMKPGLTGYWQLCERNCATYESGERQRAELYYIDNAGFWLDIKIMWRTVLMMFPKK